MGARRGRIAMTPTQLQRDLQATMTHYQAGRFVEATSGCSRLRLAAPKEAVVWRLSGIVALQQGRAVEAETHLRVALRLQPKMPEAWDNLGYALKAQGKLNEAIVAHERAVKLQPNFVDGWHNLGLALLFAGRLAESLAAQERALALEPRLAKAHFGRALALQQCHRAADAVAAYDATLALAPGHLSARSYRLLALNYQSSLRREQLFAEHLAYGAAVMSAPRSLPNQPGPDRRLRIAFLSPDLRTHSVAYFLQPILRHLDAEQFDVFLYHDHFCVDQTSSQLRTFATTWRNFSGLPDSTVERQILADAPDIVVDLAGHTGLNRLPLLAKRVAPVQLAYLGYPGTTGLRSMDYRFVDAITDPPVESDRLHTEQLVRFSSVAWAYDPPAAAPPVAVAPPCVAAGVVTFGCFNNFIKVGDELLDGWADLLRTVPNSRLRLKAQGLSDPAVATSIRIRLQRLGVAAERLELLDRTPGIAAHLALYDGVDVALDTFPYHGTTTTCEALWMGVPVVTLTGDRHASRVGTSLLTAIGHPEWIADNWQDYVRIAADLAGDFGARAETRRTLRAELQGSQLLNHLDQAERFGRGLRNCWRAYCARAAAAA